MLKSINLGIAFLLELAMLGALAYWGFQTGGSLVVQLLLGIGAPLLAILIWGRFMAPRSETRLTGLPYIAVKSILFGLAAIALASAGQVTWAIVFAVVAVVNQVLLIASKQETLQSTSG